MSEIKNLKEIIKLLSHSDADLAAGIANLDVRLKFAERLLLGEKVVDVDSALDNLRANLDRAATMLHKIQDSLIKEGEDNYRCDVQVNAVRSGLLTAIDDIDRIDRKLLKEQLDD